MHCHEGRRPDGWASLPTCLHSIHTPSTHPSKPLGKTTPGDSRVLGTRRRVRKGAKSGLLAAPGPGAWRGCPPVAWGDVDNTCCTRRAAGLDEGLGGTVLGQRPPRDGRVGTDGPGWRPRGQDGRGRPGGGRGLRRKWLGGGPPLPSPSVPRGRGESGTAPSRTLTGGCTRHALRPSPPWEPGPAWGWRCPFT